MRFEGKSLFSSGQEESEQEVIAAAIVHCDAVDVVVGEEEYTNGCWILWIPMCKLNVIHK